MSQVRRSDLVASLSNVAISALGGTLGPVGTAVARELVTTCQSLWDRGSPERRLVDIVQRSIGAWANGEEIASEVVDRGLAWAVEYVLAAGGRYEVIAEADFDPDQATAAVLNQVRQLDRYWGTEAEYAVAERAVGAAYRALCAQLVSEGGQLLAAVQATRHAALASIEELRAELVGVADRDDLIRYLGARIGEWDFSPWTQGKSPSLLERPLRLGTSDSSGAQRTTADALDGTELLVLLGGARLGQDVAGTEVRARSCHGSLEPALGPASRPGVRRDPAAD